MEACIHCDRMATHELAMTERGRTYSSPDDVEWEPICESCADDYPSTHVRPITHYACSICEREIEREHPEPPLCDLCERTAKAAGRQMAEARRFERDYNEER